MRAKGSIGIDGSRQKKGASESGLRGLGDILSRRKYIVQPAGSESGAVAAAATAGRQQSN